jgi:penicillin-binding protein 2
MTGRLKRGVMIVMNPQTGEILAMVSRRDLRQQVCRRNSRKDFQALRNPEKPLLNHAINEQFPPGSTYKLVTGLGVLADKKLGPTELVQTHPYIQIGPDRFWDWNHSGFGRLDIRSGFAHSSDTFFYQMAQRLGIERLAYWARQLGFGAKSGIDLPGEVPGIVPTNQWKQDTFGQAIFPGEVLQAGIGQGSTPRPAPDPQAMRLRMAASCTSRRCPGGRRRRRHGRRHSPRTHPQGQDLSRELPDHATWRA